MNYMVLVEHFDDVSTDSGLPSRSGRKRDWLSFEEARSIVHSLGIRRYAEWKEYIKSDQRHPRIPTNPNMVYKEEWLGWSNWLNRSPWLPFDEAREYVQTLGLKSYREWIEYCKSGQKPENIPSSPKTVYPDDWVDMYDWLGIYKFTKTDSKWLPFERAKKLVQSLGIHTSREWWEFCASSDKPIGIPTRPHRIYKKDWKGFDDWLGNE